MSMKVTDRANGFKLLCERLYEPCLDQDVGVNLLDDGGLLFDYLVVPWVVVCFWRHVDNCVNVCK